MENRKPSSEEEEEKNKEKVGLNRKTHDLHTKGKRENKAYKNEGKKQPDGPVQTKS